MRKHHVRHTNLRRYIEEFESDIDEHKFEMIICELKHSNLITAGEIHDKIESIAIFENNSERYGFLFTDMDEFRKFMPNGECGCESFDFAFYKRMVDVGDVDGFVLNPTCEGFVIVREIFEAIKLLPIMNSSLKIPTLRLS